MIKSNLRSKDHSASKWKHALVTAALLGGLAVSAIAQEVLFQESFETDGAGSRYTVTGGDVYEVQRLTDEGIRGDQAGPVYWARSPDVSIVGVPGATAAKRLMMAWDGGIVDADVTEDFLTFFDSVINWMTGGKAKAKIILVGAVSDVLINRLISKGHTAEPDDAASDLPDPSTVDAVLYGGGASGRFVNYKVPLLTWVGADHDDLLTGSIGSTVFEDLGEITITAPQHPAAGGKDGKFTFIRGGHNYELMGSILPQGSTTVAAFTRIIPATVNDLAEAEALFAGKTPSKQSSGSIAAADLVDANNPAANLISFFNFDNAVPGNPTGGFAIQATGKFQVDAVGTFTLALGTDDGGRLRIDRDGNGLTAADDVIVADAQGGFRYTVADIAFARTGQFDFEWVSFNTTGAFGAEIAVSLDAGGNVTPPDENSWDLITTVSPHVKLNGSISVKSFTPDLPPEAVHVPFLVASEGPEAGGNVFGGGPFAKFDGKAFYAGSGMNKFPGDQPRAIQFNSPVNVSGKANLKLTIAMAGTFLDFERTPPPNDAGGADFFRVAIDPNNSGIYQTLAYFTAPTGNDKFFDDASTSSTPTRLILDFQDVTYDIPPGATQLGIRIEANSSWWNEIIGFDNIRITSGAIAPPPAKEISTAGLVAYWNFDGNLNDSIKTFHGTSRGAVPVAFEDGKGGFGKAIKLDGSNFVEITGGNNKELQFPGGSMSIAGWFKVGTFDKSWQALISKGEQTNYRVARRSAEASLAYAGGVGEGTNDAPDVNDGNWHHFAAVSDATLAEFGTALYIDGTRYEVNAAKPVLADGTLNLMIGENPGALNRRWIGSIDDISIWGRVITASEVTTLYSAGAGLPLSSFVVSGGSLGVARTATGITITYEGTLQSADSVTGPWTDVGGSTSPAAISFSGSAKFYRSKQ
ncbi:MAG: hypothetical protein O2960_08850 [Verrucomicrobia bacterium]|nr:hypothetical protein [Verrucomicrobiota bacterium]